MARFLVASVAAILIVHAAFGQEREQERLYSHPAMPSPEVLARLNLQVLWRAYIPTLGRRDGLYSVQVLPDQILVVTRGSTVTGLDPVDGRTQWRARVGFPYRDTFEPAYNSNAVFLYNGLTLYGIDRRTGGILWDYSSHNAPVTSPACDEQQVYLPLAAGRLDTFQLPRSILRGERPVVNAGPDVKAATRAANESMQPADAVAGNPSAGTVAPGDREVPETAPRLVWNYQLPGGRLFFRPLVGEAGLIVVTSAGSFVGLEKAGPVVHFEQSTGFAVLTPPGQRGEIAYIPTQDYRVHAVNISSGKVLWQFTAGAPVSGRPAATADDLYVATHGAGLYRVDRINGNTIWRYPRGERFLAANRAFAYVRDQDGRLVVLDRVNGRELSMIDIRDFPVVVTNQNSDRLFLAANDGTILCLADRTASTAIPTSDTTRGPTAAPSNGTPVPAPSKPVAPSNPEGPGT